jgi:predicted ATPase
MIHKIEALNFRCLQYVHQELSPFMVLVGPNASGKTTFLDVVRFLGILVSDGLDAAVREWTPNFNDLLFNRQGGFFELAIELKIPPERQKKTKRPKMDLMRYEIRIGMDHEGVISIIEERAFLKHFAGAENLQRSLFPEIIDPPSTIFEKCPPKTTKRVLTKKPGGNDNWYSEVKETGTGWFPSIRLGNRKSTLGNLPDDDSEFPVSTWMKQLLIEGVQFFVLNSQTIRRSSPPGQPKRFKPDGSNLPWVIHDLKSNHDIDHYNRWIAHLQTALPDLMAVETVELPDTRHRYLMLVYQGNLRVPSWMASDGTLRLLALTLPAYIPSFEGVYLIEEPENGIHPLAMESIYQALSSVYGAQILMASHSPVVLSTARPEQVLCFKKNAMGATDIVSGADHPNLRNWQGEADMGTLLAAGVLG